MEGDGGGGAFADTDDPQFFGAQHGDVQPREPGLERDGGEKSSAAAAENQHVFDGRIIRDSVHAIAPALAMAGAESKYRSASATVNDEAARRRQESWIFFQLSNSPAGGV